MQSTLGPGSSTSSLPSNAVCMALALKYNQKQQNAPCFTTGKTRSDRDNGSSYGAACTAVTCISHLQKILSKLNSLG